MKNYVYRLLLLLTVLALAGCGEKKTEAVAGEAYKIYYLNTSVTKLAPYEYHTETTDTELLIQELMEQLDPLDAEILRLRYLEGITYPEISRMLEMKYETVKKRGRRGIEKAKKLAAQ